MPTLKDSYTATANDNRILKISDSYQGLSQSFTSTSVYDIGVIELLLYRQNNPAGNIWVELWTSVGDLPTTKLATSNVISASSVPTDGNGTYMGFPFVTETYELASSSKYVIVLESDYEVPSGTDRIIWRMKYTGDYLGGREAIKNTGSWAAGNGDHQLKTYEGLYQVAGTTTEDARIYVIQNDAVVNYEDVTVGSYSVQVGSTADAIVVASTTSEGGSVYNNVTPVEE